MRPAEIFFSHASEDRSAVEPIVAALRDRNLSVWYSRTSIIGSALWHDEIGKALDRCDWFVIALSRAAVESVWVKRELIYALSDHRYEERITPLLLEDCEFRRLSWVLPSIEYVDFRHDRHLAQIQLLSSLGS
ncbi:MAG: toll/interleukin-1 receptor domain-containing protein [Fimbriimonas sp.]